MCDFGEEKRGGKPQDYGLLSVDNLLRPRYRDMRFYTGTDPSVPAGVLQNPENGPQ